MSYHVVINTYFPKYLFTRTMSTVREIMGVSAPTNIPSPIAAVLKTISQGPGRKRKSFALERREVANLRDPDNPVPVKQIRKWKWRAFGKKNICHWDYREESVDSGAKFNIPVDMPDLESIDPNWLEENVLSKFSISREFLEEIWKLLRRFELRFVLVCDVLPNIALETLKDVYYTVWSQGKRCRYSASAEAARRQGLHARQQAVAQEGAERITSFKKEERRLQTEIREISNKCKMIESENQILADIIFTEKRNSKTSTSLISEKSPIKEKSLDTTSISTNFHSAKVYYFSQKVSTLIEMEKNLSQFIRRKDLECKRLRQ